MFSVLTDFFAALRRLTASANGAADDVDQFRAQLRAGLGYNAATPPALEHKTDEQPDAEDAAAAKPSKNGKAKEKTTA